jgi:hypothetical protein
LWWSPRRPGGVTPERYVDPFARLADFDVPRVTLLVACNGGTATEKIAGRRSAIQADRGLAGFEHRSGVEGRTGAD